MTAALLLTASFQAAGTGLWARQSETPIFEMLLFNWGWLESTVTHVESASAWCGFAMAAVLLVACGCLWNARLARGLTAVTPVLLLAFVWQLLLAMAAWYRDENFRPGKSWGPIEDWLLQLGKYFGEVAVRVAAPLAALLLLAHRQVDPLSERRTRGILWLLRSAAALTFAVHGYEALRSNSRFVDLLLSAADLRFLGGTLFGAALRQLLLPIGIVDLILAVAILVGRWWPVAGYMAAWGFITGTLPDNPLRLGRPLGDPDSSPQLRCTAGDLLILEFLPRLASLLRSGPPCPSTLLNVNQHTWPRPQDVRGRDAISWIALSG